MPLGGQGTAPMSTLLSAMALLLAVIPSAPSSGTQIGTLWSFEDRLAKADVVVIARRMETRDTGVRTFHVQLPSLPVVELDTEFTVLAVLKGDYPHATVVLRHYRRDWERITSGLVNAGHVLNFETRNGEYLLFLKEDVGGIYVPVSGQVFPDESVFGLH